MGKCFASLNDGEPVLHPKMGLDMKLFIQNLISQKISILIEKSPNQKSLIFIMHGLGSKKEENHIERIAASFRAKDFTVIRFDATNSFETTFRACDLNCVM